MAVYKGAAFVRQVTATGTRFWCLSITTAYKDPTVLSDNAQWDQSVTMAFGPDQVTAQNNRIEIQISQATTGLTPPAIADTMVATILHADTSTVVATVQINLGTAAQAFASLYVTSDGTSSGTPLVGDFRLVVRAVRTSVGTYDVNSDTQVTSGMLRISPTSMNVQMWHSGAADPASYGDNIEVNIDLSHSPGLERAHRHFDVRAINADTLVEYAVQRTAGTDPQNTLMKVNNRFPAMQVSVNIDVEVVAVPSAIAPTSDPTVTWITVPAATADRIDPTRVRKGPVPVDATIWLNHHLQVNSGTYDPALDQASRLTSDLGFITTQVTNARDEVLSGITYRSVLRDADNLVAPAVDRTVTTDATGRPPTMASWDSQLPGGRWLHEGTITGPSDAVGLEFSLSEERTLISANPALSMICGAGPSGTGNDVRHIEPGMTVLIGLTVLDVFAQRQVAVDTGTARAALCRFNLAFGRAEFLAEDGTWMPVNGNAIHFWPLGASAGDSNTYIRTFTGSEAWGVADLFVVGEATVAGAPLTNFMKEVVVSGVNNHDAYKFDGAGFVGFPTR